MQDKTMQSIVGSVGLDLNFVEYTSQILNAVHSMYIIEKCNSGDKMLIF